MEGKKRKMKQDYKDMRRIMSEVEAAVTKNTQVNKEPENASPKDNEDSSQKLPQLIKLLIDHNEMTHKELRSVRSELAIMKSMVEDLHRGLCNTPKFNIPISDWKKGMELPLRQELIAAFKKATTLAQRADVFAQFFNPRMFGVMVRKARKMKPILIFSDVWSTFPTVGNDSVSDFLTLQLRRHCTSNRRRSERHNIKAKATAENNSTIIAEFITLPTSSWEDIKEQPEDHSDKDDDEEEEELMYFDDDPQ